MNKRRKLVIALGASPLAVSPALFAQQQAKVWRVGFFYFGSRRSALDTGRYDAFVRAMRALGYVEGENLVIEARFGDGKIELLPGLAADLAGIKVDAIVATGGQTYGALLQSNDTIPVVATVATDPVAEGLAASLARPGGRFTGLCDTAGEHGPKELELLMTAVPRVSRVGVLANPHNVGHPRQVKQVAAAAAKIGVSLLRAEAGTAAGVASSLGSLRRERADAFIVLGDAFFVQEFQQIAATALRLRLPSIGWIHEYAQAGGLMSYGADVVDNFRRAASYVDRILKGARPGELPFEQPTRYALAINLETAKALGLTIAQSLLLRADELIQ